MVERGGDGSVVHPSEGRPTGAVPPEGVDAARLARAVAAAERRPLVRSTRQLERLAAIGSIELAGELTEGPQPTLRRIVRATTPLLPGCGGVSAVLYDHATGSFRTSATTVPGQDDQESATRVRRSRGATRFVVDRGVGLYVEDIAEDPFGANAMLQETGNHAYVGFPLRSGQRTLGVIYAMGRSPGQFDDEDLELLSVVSDRAAVVVQAAQEHAGVTRLARHAEMLATIGAAVTSDEEPTAHLREVLSLAVTALDLDAIALVPRVPESSYELVTAGPRPEPWSVYARPLGIGDALAERHRADEVFTTAVGHRPERRATLAAVRSDPPFDARDLATLAHLATTLTVALDRAAAFDEIRASNEALTRFAHVASHDLRSPLTTVVGFLDLLLVSEGETLSEEGRRFAAKSAAAANRMADTVATLLTHAELTGASPEPRPTDLGELVQQVISDLAGVIEREGARIVISELITADVDPAAFRIVVQNLIANALKFHRPGVAPVVTVSARRDGPGWRLEVCDEGTGIAEADRERVFELFERGVGASAPGAGIGLATVTRIVAAHGGKVRAEPGDPLGTRVIVEVPDPPRGADLRVPS